MKKKTDKKPKAKPKTKVTKQKQKQSQSIVINIGGSKTKAKSAPRAKRTPTLQQTITTYPIFREEKFHPDLQPMYKKEEVRTVEEQQVKEHFINVPSPIPSPIPLPFPSPILSPISPPILSPLPSQYTTPAKEKIPVKKSRGRPKTLLTEQQIKDKKDNVNRVKRLQYAYKKDNKKRNLNNEMGIDTPY